MSQEKLGEALGLTFQQVQKYERGANRISASRLFDLSRVLDVPVSFFFDDMDETTEAASPARMNPDARMPIRVDEGEVLMKRETLEFVRAYYRMPESARAAFVSLVRSAGAEEG